MPKMLQYYEKGMPKTLGIWEWGCPKSGVAQNAVTEALKKYLGASAMCKCLVSVLSSKLPLNITQASTTKAKLLRVYIKAS